MIKEFYYVDSNRKQVGPIAYSSRRSVGLKPSTLVWHADLADWAKAGSLSEFKDVFTPTPPPIPNDETTRLAAQKPITNRYESFEDDTVRLDSPSPLRAKLNRKPTPYHEEEVSPKKKVEKTPGSRMALIGVGLIIVAIFSIAGIKLIPFFASIFDSYVYTAGWIYAGAILLILIIIAFTVSSRDKFLAWVLAATGVLGGAASMLTMMAANESLWFAKYKNNTAVSQSIGSIHIYDKWGNQIYYLFGDQVKLLRVKNVKDEPFARFITIKMDVDQEQLDDDYTADITIELLDWKADMLDSHHESLYVDGNTGQWELLDTIVEQLKKNGNFQIDY